MLEKNTQRGWCGPWSSQTQGRRAERVSRDRLDGSLVGNCKDFGPYPEKPDLSRDVAHADL